MKMKTKTAQSSAPPVNNEEADAMEDTSLLRLPVTTAKIGFLEAHLAYDSGTDEVNIIFHPCTGCFRLSASN